MSESLILQVYISYNTVHKPLLTALENSFKKYNEDPDSIYQIQVKYSENSIDDADSIVEFMDEIALARFVVLFFSKEYFESPYCLYELITSYEKQSLAARSFILPIKPTDLGSAINTYTEISLIDAWKGQGDLTQATKNKEKNFCQNKLKELLNLENDEIETKIKTVYREFILPWLDKKLPVKSAEETLQEIVIQAKQAFEFEIKEFDKSILENVERELGSIKNLEQSWENYSGKSLKKIQIAKKLMDGDYSDALRKIQSWTKAAKKVMLPNEWRYFFNTMQKIAGWFVLKSINQDWWINNLLSFTEGAQNHGFVKLGLDNKNYCYSEVVVSKALRKSARFLLDDQNKLISSTKEYALNEGNDFVFDCSADASLHTLLVPIVTDLRKKPPQIEDAKELLDDLLNFASGNEDSFFYLVKEDYLNQLRSQKAPDGSGKTVLEVINNRLKDQLFFIAIDTKIDSSAPQVTDNFIQAISLMENILIIDE